MLTVIVIAVLVGTFSTYSVVEDIEEWYQWLDWFIAFIWVGFTSLGAFVGIVIAFVGGCYMQRQDVVVIHPISSIASTGDFKGKFVIVGSGETGSPDIYHFMELRRGDVPKQQNVLADFNLQIVEDRNLTAVGYWEETFNQPDPHSFLNILALQRGPVSTNVELRIPVGSLVRYSADPTR